MRTADALKGVSALSQWHAVPIQGIWEQIVGGASKLYYTFNGQVVALRDAGGVTYLSGDHLGSVSLATNASGAVVSKQDFDPWGKVRNGGVAATSLNYTGQRLDTTGLLYYHARYYDPALARFVSADSVVPGAGSLTVAPHDATAQAVWATRGGGAVNPQELNRYSYGLNNPVKNTDPSGHCIGPVIVICGAVAVKALFDAVVVVVGGYLIYDGVSNLASTSASDSASNLDDSQSGSVEPSVGTDTGQPDTDAQSNATAVPRGGTYVLKNPETGEIERSGRTNDLARRQAEHARDPRLKDLDFDVDARTDDYAEQRGREQYLHEKYNPPRNRVGGVDPKNPNAPKYRDANGRVKGKY